MHRIPQCTKLFSPFKNASNVSKTSLQARRSCSSFSVAPASFHLAHSLPNASRTAPKSALGPSFRGIRTKSKPSKLDIGPTEAERAHAILTRMLEQRQINISRCARERDWFLPSDLILPPAGWSYAWQDWVAGWEVVPIVSRSQLDLTLEHFYGMGGRYTPVIFQRDPHAPDFIFQYEGVHGARTGPNDRGVPGAYYYYRMGDDGLFKFANKYDNLPLEDFVREAAGTSDPSQAPGHGLEHMMPNLTAVPEHPDSNHSMQALRHDLGVQLLEFEQRMTAVARDGKKVPATIASFMSAENPSDQRNGTDTSPEALAEAKIQTLLERYQGYSSYGVYSVYTFAEDEAPFDERRAQKLKYLEEVKDFEERVAELKEELHEITDEENEFEVLKEEKRGRNRKEGKKKRTQEE